MAKCRACAADIQFMPTERGKLMPVDADGTSHFACAAAFPTFGDFISALAAVRRVVVDGRVVKENDR